MTAGLPSSGSISMNQIRIEVLLSGNQIDLNNSKIRELFGVSSGQISMSSGYSKRWVTPGSSGVYGYTGANQFFPVPRYETLTVTVNAAGGGSSGLCGNDGFAHGYCGGAGGAGENSRITGTKMTTITAGGGAGSLGSRQSTDDNDCQASGAAGGGSGGSVVVGGGAAGGINNTGNCGIAGRGDGGAGGKVTKTWNWFDADAPPYGSQMTIYIGAGGSGGSPGESAGTGNPGGSGSASFSWT